MQDKIRSKEIIFSSDEARIIRKLYLREQEGQVPETLWSHEEVGSSRSANSELKALFGTAEIYATPKPSPLVQRTVQLSGSENIIVVDYFAGSGTTGHAVISQNRQDQGKRRFILIEMEEHFDTVLIPRIKKITFTPEWKDGKPKRMATREEAERSPRIIK